MSRYRATTRELLEQVRQESRMKDIYNMAFDGDSAEDIAKKLKLDVATVKKVLGEINETTFPFTKRQFKNNEKENKHSENALALAKMFGTGKEIHDMKSILKFLDQRGYINKKMFDVGVKITKKYYSKLKEEVELKEYNPDFGKDTKAGRTKETHADDKKTKDEDRIKSLENEIQRLKLELENEKNATVKPEPNPDTGEVPLTVGIAHKYLKDKEKKEVKKEELEESLFGVMYNKLVKSVQRMPKDQFVKKYVGTSITPGSDKMKKNDLEDIWNTWNKKEEIEEAVIADKDYKYDGKGPVKISMKNYAKVPLDVKAMITGKPYMMALNPKTQKTELVPVVFEEVELTEYFATVYLWRGLSRSDKAELTDFIKKNKKDIDYVDDDAGGNIEFEGKGAHALADKIKAKFGNKIKKESFEPIGEELEEDTNKYITEKIKGLENKAKKSGMPYSILKKVYDRGMAAWKGGHRPGATQQQWAFARVNSFVTKSSGTWGKADKDLAEKVRAAESVELDENFSSTMVAKLKKAYEPLRGKKIAPGGLMKIFDKIDKNKNALIQLFKADIPFVSQMAVSRLISKHNMKGAEINKLREELNELQNYSRQLKDPSKEMMVVDKNGRVSVIDRSEFEKYKRQGYMPAEETENEACWDTHKQVGFKMKGGKRVPNCVPKNEELEEANLTDKQVDMVKKVADKLPKDDFKKRYGKDADNVKFGTATNIVKKKLKIDEYEGARTLVDRLLKQERGDE